MTTCSVKPADLSGRMRVPPSKSMGHRALFCAALASGESHIDNFVMSRDMQATLAALRVLGVNTEVLPSTRFSGRLCVHVLGTGTLTPTGEVVDCYESGSTARFVIPYSRLVGDPVTVTGQNGLLERPFGLFRDLFQGKGVKIRSTDAGTHTGGSTPTTGLETGGMVKDGWNGLLPLTLSGALQSGVFRLKGNVSSQFITGMLFVLPLLSGDSEILVEGPLESAPYVEMTLEMMRSFGVRASMTLNPGPEGIGALLQIPGGQRYRPASLDVEGDWSQAAFWLVAGALGHRIELEGLRADSLQGDRAILQFLRRMGTPIHQVGTTLCFDTVSEAPQMVEEGQCRHAGDAEESRGNKDSFPLAGDAEESRGNKGRFPLAGIDMDVSQCPDLVPALAIAAAHADGISRIGNAARLRIKESDRLSAVREMLEALGVQVVEEPDALVITGRPSGFTGGFVDGHNDHRIVMAAAIAGTRTAPGNLSGVQDEALSGGPNGALSGGPNGALSGGFIGSQDGVVRISYMEAVQKSYPDFWTDYQTAGGILIQEPSEQGHLATPVLQRERNER